MKTHKWKEVRNHGKSPERLARLERRVESELIEMSLADLRRELGVTQEEMARAADMTQSQLSKLERRSDHLISTLNRAVRALGGELEVTAVVGDKRVRLTV